VCSFLDLIGRYSKSYLQRWPTEQLQHILNLAQTSQRVEPTTHRSQVQILSYPLRIRLGSEKVNQLVADYQSGITTTQLMKDYKISKTSVLKLLKNAGVKMRHQSLTKEQVNEAAVLYEGGRSLAVVAATMGLPQESLRRAMITIGMKMRSTGRPTGS
jgi:hypothetical protein